jgi:hypothetical protein
MLPVSYFVTRSSATHVRHFQYVIRIQPLARLSFSLRERIIPIYLVSFESVTSILRAQDGKI